MSTLADILADMRDPDAEVSLSDARVTSYLDGITDDALAEKVDAMAVCVKDMESLAKGRQEEAARLSKSAKSLKSRAGYLKAVLKGVASRFGGRLRGKNYRISVAKNGGAPAMLSPSGEPLGDGPATLDLARELGVLQVKESIDTEKLRQLLADENENQDHPVHKLAKLTRGTHTRIS